MCVSPSSVFKTSTKVFYTSLSCHKHFLHRSHLPQSSFDIFCHATCACVCHYAYVSFHVKFRNSNQKHISPKYLSIQCSQLRLYHASPNCPNTVGRCRYILIRNTKIQANNQIHYSTKLHCSSYLHQYM